MYLALTQGLRRVSNRVRAELSYTQFCRDRYDKRYYHQLANYSYTLSDPGAEDLKGLQNLREHGISITSLEDLNLPLNLDLLEDVSTIWEILERRQPKDGSFLVKATADEICSSASIFHWGLQCRLINIIETYLGLPAVYHGAYFRKDCAVPVKKKSRLWHLDKEDRRMIKIILYLNEVTEQDGPLEYISKKNTDFIKSFFRYRLGEISDSRMIRACPESNWKPIPGKKYTLIMFDPAQVFHRGKIPARSDRYTIFYDYTSCIPERPYYCKNALSKEQRQQLKEEIPMGQDLKICWR